MRTASTRGSIRQPQRSHYCAIGCSELTGQLDVIAIVGITASRPAADTTIMERHAVCPQVRTGAVSKLFIGIIVSKIPRCNGRSLPDDHLSFRSRYGHYV